MARQSLEKLREGLLEALRGESRRDGTASSVKYGKSDKNAQSKASAKTVFENGRADLKKKSVAAESSAGQQISKEAADGRVPAEHVVVIDDEDSCFDAELHKSKGKNGNARVPVSTDDDCQVTGFWYSPKLQQFKRVEARRPSAWKEPVVRHKIFDSSDCDVTMGSQSHIRKLWEEAADRKRRGRPATTKGSSSGKQESSSLNMHDDQKHSSAETASTSTSFPAEETNNFRAENVTECDCNETSRRCSRVDTPDKEKCGPDGRNENSKTSETMGADMVAKPESNEGKAPTPIADREKHKQSDEFRRADQEEWERRQQELKKQAEEAQRLKKRKRAEADRQLAMENRQKQRLRQIRENQIQEMKNSDMKDLLRGQIQADLEQKAAGCVDMASLLRRLGIAVGGGPNCTPQQVNAAYKKALLRFHPDRAAATANNDPRVQVEAEETFKLISRLKATLQFVPQIKPRQTRK